MPKIRVNKEALKFIKTGFKSEKEMESVRNDYLKMRNLVKYNGDQEIMGVMFPVFTDKMTGSSFMVCKGDKLKDVLDSVRDKFK